MNIIIIGATSGIGKTLYEKYAAEIEIGALASKKQANAPFLR